VIAVVGASLRVSFPRAGSRTRRCSTRSRSAGRRARGGWCPGSWAFGARRDDGADAGRSRRPCSIWRYGRVSDGGPSGRPVVSRVALVDPEAGLDLPQPAIPVDDLPGIEVGETPGDDASDPVPPRCYGDLPFIDLNASVGEVEEASVSAVADAGDPAALGEALPQLLDGPFAAGRPRIRYRGTGWWCRGTGRRSASHGAARPRPGTVGISGRSRPRRGGPWPCRPCRG